MSKKKQNNYFQKSEKIEKEVKKEDRVRFIPLKVEEISTDVFDEEEFPDWKKIEIEIIRDKDGNCICLGSREFINKDISILPVTTIPNKHFQLMRTESIKIATELKIIGNLNVRFVVNPATFEYKLTRYTKNSTNTLIEKASNYPAESVLFKIYAGVVIDAITVNGKSACYEPTLTNITMDIKNKFTVTTNNLEKAILKASCESRELNECFRLEDLVEKEKDEIEDLLKDNDSNIFFLIAEAIRKEISVEKICNITKIDKFYVGSVYKIVKVENELALNYLDYKLVLKAINIGFSPATISYLSGKEEKEIIKIIEKNKIKI